MKPVRILMCLLSLLLSACTHNAKQAQIQSLAPPIEDTPPPPPDSAPANLPAPVIPIPKTETPVVVQEQPKPAPRHHKPKPSPPSQGAGAPQAPQAPQEHTQVAAAEPPPAEVSAIDQLSPTEPPNSKKQAEDSISEVERGLTGINRSLDSQEEKTSTQIKEFLKQARTALASGDVEGAKTLAKKAKALLGELSQ
ncbi:MAG TPA: hypothetical protein VFD98_12795 [Terracidiphilus sp.]|nr:hypothetical protein [Terracidiphilus sp.]